MQNLKIKNTQQSTLRKSLRKQRLTRSPRQRKLASHQAFRRLSRLPITLPRYAKIGIYLDAFGEMPIQPIIDWAKRHHFDLYLPIVLGKNKPLKFVKMAGYNPKNWRLIRHNLGMRQPARTHKAITANQLDMVFLPLVAIDKQGYRMGMGGGFYDRTLAKFHKKPIKIGWAYDFQLIEPLEINAWDIRLNFAILASQLLKFPRNDTIATLGQALTLENYGENQEGIHGELSEQLISQVMNPDRLADLLQRANAFERVHSEGFF